MLEPQQKVRCVHAGDLPPVSDADPCVELGATYTVIEVRPCLCTPMCLDVWVTLVDDDGVELWGWSASRFEVVA